MGFFDTDEGIEQYIEMAEGYDGAELIEVLGGYVPEDASVLELGMGPGVDLDILARSYRVTGSDTSERFLERYRRSHPGADLMRLDAVALDTDRTFDAIYSNKVLHHLSAEELQASLNAQLGVLVPGGMALHSLWWGDKPEEWMEGLRFTYYTEDSLASILGRTPFETLAMKRYSETDEDDSLYVVLRAPGAGDTTG